MKYYYLVSGGRDSTAMVLDAYEQGKTGDLVWGNTRITLATARKTLQKLAAYVGWPLHEVRYEGEQSPISIVKESFQHIPKALEILKERGVYRRNVFRCCHILKHQPMNDWLKEQDTDSCFVLGIKGGDHVIHRIYRMRELREQDTFYRRHKSTGLLYYYPLRDWSDTEVTKVLKRHGFGETHGSGCTICPIFCLFDGMRKKDPDTWRRSVQMADSLGIEHPASGQQFFPCTGVP